MNIGFQKPGLHFPEHSPAHSLKVAALGWLVFLLLIIPSWNQSGAWISSDPLHLPEPGEHQLRALTPTLLELLLITTKEPDPAPLSQWDFVQENGFLDLPSPAEFEVRANGKEIPVERVGFKRRVIYAPLERRDLRIGNSLYLVLESPLEEGERLVVENPGAQLWDEPVEFAVEMDPFRFSPVLHVNQAGYTPGFPKKAMAGFYLGSLGELDLPAGEGFRILDAVTGAVAFEGQLRPRPDAGYLYLEAPYQQVYEADFSALNAPGEYLLWIPGLGSSYPFMIHEGTLAAFARAYAQGLYQQRCGAAKCLPYTRHCHDVCHDAPAEIPTMAFVETGRFLAESSADYASNPRHTAPQLKDVDSSLYPFERQGTVDVSGGHHDAGDYSKYTINSAQLIHHLVFAADNFPGAAELDNLGWPESGDGKSDLLQAAKWEADFLVKMQDSDGGFYFLVYPKTRRYEENVLPDKGDPQVVWPKTTAATAAAVAALAEIGSSPRFKQEHPETATRYLEAATQGWRFLETAIETHGWDGAYQKLTHYGNEFMHDDELAWAAAAMFVATGDPEFQELLLEWFPDPSDRDRHRWTWWRLFEGYGCAVRTYAFAARSGRLPSNALDPGYLEKCQAEILACADEQAQRAAAHAYGSSFPFQYKAHRTAGWFFSSDRAYDLTVAYQLEPKEEYIEAILTNLNYEGGCNPLNRPFITGIGWQRQREIVHQHAQNDWQTLPPSGLPLGNIQAGFTWLHHYKDEPAKLSYPPDNSNHNPFPFYDRWADTFNITTEATIVEQARSLASLTFWMAASGLADQPWRPVAGEIIGIPSSIPAGQPVTAQLHLENLSLSGALIVWEARDQQPQFGPEFTFVPQNMGTQWIEAEAQWPDGRRVFAQAAFTATTPLDYPPNSHQSAPVEGNEHTVALFHLDGDPLNAMGTTPDLALSSGARFDSSNLGWMAAPSGYALRVEDLGDNATVAIPGLTLYSSHAGEITMEAMIYIEELRAWNRSPALILSLRKGWNAYLELIEDPYKGLLVRGYGWEFSGPALDQALSPGQWRHLSLSLNPEGYSLRIDGQTVASLSGALFDLWGNSTPVQLEFGNFQGWIDEVVVRNGPLSSPEKVATPLISPPGGEFSGSIEVTLSCDTPGASIYLTLDGADPTTQSTLYTGPITLTQSALLKTRAFQDGMVESEAASATFTITPPPSGQAVFAGSDSLTQGFWKGVYGASGFDLIGHSASYPPNVQAVPSGHASLVWAQSTREVRALERVNGRWHFAGGWHAPEQFTLRLDLTGAQPMRVGFYFLDWDSDLRSQRVDALDTRSGAVLDSRVISSFREGSYLFWEVEGEVLFEFTRLSGSSAVLSGLFFDQNP